MPSRALIRRLANWRKQENVLQFLAVACLVMMALLGGRPSFTNASKPPRGMTIVPIALEQARSVEDIDAILGDAPSPDREVMRIKVLLGWPLILICVAIAGIASNILMRRNRAAILLWPLGLIVAVLATLESRALVQLINSPLSQTTPHMLDGIRLLSTGKWIAGAATLIVFSVFYFLGRPWFAKLVGAVNLLVAVVLIVGLFETLVLPMGVLGAGIALSASAATLKFVRYEESSPRNSVPRPV
jgi:hypothetical protein